MHFDRKSNYNILCSQHIAAFFRNNSMSGIKAINILEEKQVLITSELGKSLQDPS